MHMLLHMHCFSHVIVDVLPPNSLTARTSGKAFPELGIITGTWCKRNSPLVHLESINIYNHKSWGSRMAALPCGFCGVAGRPEMEDQESFIDDGKKKAVNVGRYDEELDVAVRAVQLACSLCQRVQQRLIENLNKEEEEVKSKKDKSLVTVADWSVQAIISWILCDYFGCEGLSIVAEEDVQALTQLDSATILEAVVKNVKECLDEAPVYGFRDLKKLQGASDVIEAIGRCNSKGGPVGRHWVLDPVDGTLGFVRGDQYAVALALIDEGKVALGVLGCPNYPMNKELLNYHHGYYRLVSPATESWHKGCIFYAQKGTGEAWMQPLAQGVENKPQPDLATKIHVSSIDDPALATFCEPVEKGNSRHSFTAGLAQSVGLRNQPLRVYSMVKYAAIARGDAEIFMKFAPAGYKEKIWDHAAGVLIIHEAGGVVTDAGGKLLDFSTGIYLEGLDRGIIACSGASLHEKIIRAVDASWDSSSL